MAMFEMATNPSQICRHEGCELPVVTGLEQEGLCINHYLEVAFQGLWKVTESVHTERDADPVTLDWLFAQVDFAVETLAQQNNLLDTKQRTRLLELLLGVVNLHEHMRHSAVPVLGPA
jgi:hypothetical protein